LGVNIAEQKRAARKNALIRRQGLSVAERHEKSLAIAERIVGWPLFVGAATIHIYLSFRDEVETEAVFPKALSSGKVVAVPVTFSSGDRRGLGLIRIDRFPPDRLVRGPWGVDQPAWDPALAMTPGEIDLWIIPGIAFDPQGRRLGYGGGYYDRTMRGTRGVVAGLAFEVQMEERLPEGSSDVRVQWIITEKRVISCSD
jgi:5-formyltetrahydrofolate cyclo-ligase